MAALTKHKKEKGHKNPAEKCGRKKKQLIDRKIPVSLKQTYVKVFGNNKFIL